jgi:hypothetical protein
MRPRCLATLAVIGAIPRGAKVLEGVSGAVLLAFGLLPVGAPGLLE